MGSEDEIPLKPHAGHEGVAIKRPTDHVLAGRDAHDSAGALPLMRPKTKRASGADTLVQTSHRETRTL